MRRPLLACEWIRGSGTPPPMEFSTLVASAVPDGRLRDAIEKLISRKIAGDELQVEPQMAVINEYLEDRIAYYAEFTKTIPKTRPDIDLLDTILPQHIS